MRLPEAFLEDLRRYVAPAELARLTEAIVEGEATCSVRVNGRKCASASALAERAGWGQVQRVPWCPEGLCLERRPSFTLDPRLHAGAYYVQEAASMMVSHVVRALTASAPRPLVCLDLCAAPGGKSTAALSALPEGSLLVSNEVDRRRARILAENLAKWGWPESIVTASPTQVFRPFSHAFDLVIADVPCSGEGMFRKDEGALADWSPAKVARCVAVQREILSDVWGCLKPGGWLVYSTCTYNVHEDEEQIEWLTSQFGAEPVDVPVEAGWGIAGPLTGRHPCFRFMPHLTPGEGLFMAVVRKGTGSIPAAPSAPSGLSEATSAEGDRPSRRTGRGGGAGRGDSSFGSAGYGNASHGSVSHARSKAEGRGGGRTSVTAEAREAAVRWVDGPTEVLAAADGSLRAVPPALAALCRQLEGAGVYLLQAGTSLGVLKGHDLVPAHGLVLSTALRDDAFPRVELSHETALTYLRREAITLPPGTPVGYVVVTYDALPLGLVKNVGSRCNSLYPQEWRIRYV